ncbi:hypothetical protein WQO_10465 [Streptomyces globisporus C-1027]|uniref:Uncharacterized protein n=1 Tax=Streptomyces globisporus C-1027 TaxID=1172567 RepID=A0A0U3LD71_STRGL|nr:hypothetical protein WQO_10465 [Streptomyces globisporus C-1027]
MVTRPVARPCSSFGTPDVTVSPYAMIAPRWNMLASDTATVASHTPESAPRPSSTPMNSPWPMRDRASVRRAPTRPITLAANIPATTDSSPWTPKTSPVANGERCRTSWRYRVRTKTTVLITEKVTRPPRLPNATRRRTRSSAGSAWRPPSCGCPPGRTW